MKADVTLSLIGLGGSLLFLGYALVQRMKPPVIYDDHAIAKEVSKRDPVPQESFSDVPALVGPRVVGVWFGSCGSCRNDALSERKLREISTDGTKVVLLATDPSQLPNELTRDFPTVACDKPLRTKLNAFFWPRWYAFSSGHLTAVQKFGTDFGSTVRGLSR